MGNIFTDIENIEQKVVNFFKGVPQDAQVILSASNKFLNTIKVLSTSATGQTIIDLAEAFFPSVTAIVTGAEALLSQLLGITAETPGQLLLQASQKAAALTGDAKIVAFSNIATAVSTAANAATQGTLTTQQILSVNQVVHAPDVLSTAVAPAPVIPSPLPNA